MGQVPSHLNLIVEGCLAYIWPFYLPSHFIISHQIPHKTPWEFDWDDIERVELEWGRINLFMVWTPHT